MIKITYPGFARIRSSPSMATANNIEGTVAFGTMLNVRHKVGEWYVVDSPTYIHQSVAEVVPDTYGVPYYSQWGAGANRVNADCGQACVKMMLAHKGMTLDVPIDTLSAMIGAPAGWTTAEQLIRLMGLFGLKARRSAAMGQLPCIALVDYSKMPARNKQDLGFKGNHWIVLVGQAGGVLYYHDPDTFAPNTSKGAFLSLAEGEFSAASLATFVLLEET